MGTHQTQQKLAEWLAGNISADGRMSLYFGGFKLAGWARKYLLHEADYRCTQCGWGERHPLTGESPLEVDHIDGDGANNFRSNLRVLCPNCHSLTPTYRGHNVKRRRSLELGVHERRERV